jgi:hypothetical protein
MLPSSHLFLSLFSSLPQLPHYISYSGDGLGDQLPPPVIVWWWDYATQEPELQPMEFLEIVTDDPAAVGHLVGWLDDCPDVLHCYTGDLSMPELSDRVNAAINHPCPPEYSPERVIRMVEHIQSGIPLYVEDQVERLKLLTEKQETIVTVKEAQYQRKLKASEERKRKAEEKRAQIRGEKTPEKKKRKKAPVPETDVEGSGQQPPTGTATEVAEISSGSSDSSLSSPSSDEAGASPRAAKPPPKPRTKPGGKGRERAQHVLQERQAEWDETMGQRTAQEQEGAAAAPATEEPTEPAARPPTPPAAGTPPRSPRARSTSSGRSSDPRQPFRAPKLAPGAQSPSEMLRQRLSYSSRSPAKK